MGEIDSGQRPGGPKDDAATTVKPAGETGADLTVQELDTVAGGKPSTTSTKLMNACCTGKHIAEVTIEF